MRDILISTVLELNKTNNIYFLTADLGFKCFDELEKKLGKKYINVGVCEQNMVNLSTGIYLNEPNANIFIYSIGNFPSLRCLEQIRNSISYHMCKVLIVSNGSGFSYGQLGSSHHATEDFGVMRSIPNINIYTPCTNKMVAASINHWIKNHNPGYIRLDKQVFTNKKYLIKESNCFEDIVIIKDSKKICNELHIFAGGISSLLNGKDIEVDICLINYVPKGLNQKLIDVIIYYKKVIVYEEHNIDNGFGAYVAWHIVKSKLLIEIESKSIPNQLPSYVGDQNYMRESQGITF